MTCSAAAAAAPKHVSVVRPLQLRPVGPGSVSDSSSLRLSSITLTYLCCQASGMYFASMYGQVRPNLSEVRPHYLVSGAAMTSLNRRRQCRASRSLPFAVDKTAQLAPSPPLTSQLLFYPILSRKPNPMQMKRMNRMNN